MPNRYLICSSCDAMNPSFGVTCDQCGAPISDISTNESSQPTESVAKRTHFQPPSTLRLIGIWSIALPNVIAGVWFAFWVFKHRGGLWAFIFFWGNLGLTLLWFVIFFRVTKHYFFRHPKME